MEIKVHIKEFAPENVIVSVNKFVQTTDTSQRFILPLESVAVPRISVRATYILIK